MAQVSNSTFTSGTAITAASLNFKFVEITTATTADVDNTNVSTEGIDFRQLNSSYRLKAVKHIDNLATANQDYEDGWEVSGGAGVTGATPITHGTNALELNFGATGQVLAATDLMRLNWLVMQVTWATTGANMDQYDCWVVHAEWDITSNALTNYEPLPLCSDWGAAWTNLVARPYDASMGMSVIPMGFEYEDAGTKYKRHIKNGSRGCFNYIHTGASVTIYGIKLYISGPYRIGYFGAPVTDEVFYPWQSDKDDITLKEGMLTCLIYRC